MPEEPLKDKIVRAKKIITLLKKRYPNAKCSLKFKTVHQLMVATILSAQCTDERVNQVTKTLFKRYNSIEDFADADLQQLGKDIYATGFHNNKARSIKLSAQQLLENHGGRIPRRLDELVKLAGVGRKTASVILGAGFGLAEGIVVDTHVARLSRLLKFTDRQDRFKIETDLMKIIPKKDWIGYAYLMIDHGRAICRARPPDCASCFLSKLCPSAKALKRS
jgi:endonuclease-3